MLSAKDIFQSPNKTLLASCFGFLVGTAVASLVHVAVAGAVLFGMVATVIGLLVVFWRELGVRLVFMIVACIALGFTWYSLHVPPLTSYVGPQTFTASIVREPDVRQGSVRYVLESEEIAGGMYMILQPYPRYAYGDQLSVTCRLTQPEPIDVFQYDKYLLSQGAAWQCSGAEVDKIGSGKGNALMGSILALKGRVARQVNLLWHEPYSGLFAGLLYGYRGGLGSLDEAFKRTGLTHIVAVSGYNVSLVAALLLPILYRLRIPRKKAFWLVVAGIATFVLFTGASSSVVRAGVMGILTLLGSYWGRSRGVGTLVIAAAVIMVLTNPFVLMWDPGFQLSFLATLGLVYLSPHITARLPDKIPGIFSESLATTLSAIVMTLPLQLTLFGQLSLVAPLANVLILWTIPWLMIGSAISVLLSFVLFPLGQVVGWLVFAAAALVVWVVRMLASLPFAAISITLPVFVAVIMYGLLLVLFLRKRRTTFSSGR